MNIGFALEYALGHITHAQNLKRTLESRIESGDTSVTPYYVDLAFDDRSKAYQRVRGIKSNWSVRASIGAYVGLRRLRRAHRLDGLLFHTQVTSLFSVGVMRRIPSVVSLDATPLQFDAIGETYGHRPSENARVEDLKRRMNQRSFNAAQTLVTWSEWTKASLVADYGVPPAKVVVIPPGIDIAQWSFDRAPTAENDVTRVLFVGGDFRRKGGDVLLNAWEALPAPVRDRARLDIVTKSWSETDEAAAREGANGGTGMRNVFIHRNLTPNAPALRELYGKADLFAFPTRGDCLPLAVLEALASGLPVITTDVGALGEAVRDGETGAVIPIGDASALTTAMTELIENGPKRRQMAKTARAEAVGRFDAARNYARLVQTVCDVAANGGSGTARAASKSAGTS